MFSVSLLFSNVKMGHIGAPALFKDKIMGSLNIFYCEI